MQKAVDIVTKETGYIDLLICNAGMSTAEKGENPRPKPKQDSSISEIRDYYFNYRDPTIWRDTLETNVAATFTTSMAFLELLDEGNKRREKGRPTSQIIAVGSAGGLLRFTDPFICESSELPSQTILADESFQTTHPKQVYIT